MTSKYDEMSPQQRDQALEAIFGSEEDERGPTVADPLVDIQFTYEDVVDPEASIEAGEKRYKRALIMSVSNIDPTNRNVFVEMVKERHRRSPLYGPFIARFEAGDRMGEPLSVLDLPKAVIAACQKHNITTVDALAAARGIFEAQAPAMVVHVRTAEEYLEQKRTEAQAEGLAELIVNKPELLSKVLAAAEKARQPQGQPAEKQEAEKPKPAEKPQGQETGKPAEKPKQ